jgi:2-keto-4-pentenoate hydratase/2-oxohepta-3-ene-1,7-dioic acid hydratase in catechol pathway
VKLLYFDDWKVGVLRGESVVDVSSVVADVPHLDPQDIMRSLIARFDEYRPRLEEAAKDGKGVPISKVRVRAPLPRPVHIVAMAVNYLELLPIATGQEKPPPGERTKALPINAFHKSPTGIIGPEEEMILGDVPATIFEGEAELGIVIGKRASNVKKADAMGHVFGYVNFIDGSARGLPPDRNVFYQMKSRETYAPIGPWIVTADEIPDPYKMRIRLWNNGTLMQDYTTEHMANDIARSIEFTSAVHPLEPGDILAAGTDHAGLNPFQHGDRIEQEIDGLGRLTFKVRDDLRRTWARETRRDRYQKGLTGTTPQLTGRYAPEKKPN